MDIALCYESVDPAKGGAETYISALMARLAADGHAVHLYAARWAEGAIPAGVTAHRLTIKSGPRFLRPWRFARACLAALAGHDHDVTVGFDKTFGQDVLYPQGGLHAASRAHNRRKGGTAAGRLLAAVGQALDPAGRSFAALEKRQYLGPNSPLIVANSGDGAGALPGVPEGPAGRVRVVHSAVPPGRSAAPDRAARRAAERARWGVPGGTPAGLMVAMNYRLKGLAPLVRAVATLTSEVPFVIAVVGHPGLRPVRGPRVAARVRPPVPVPRLPGGPARRLLVRRISSSTRRSTTRARWSRSRPSRPGYRW